MGSQQSSEQHNKLNVFLTSHDGKVTEYNNLGIGAKELSSYKGVKTDFALSSEKGEQATKDSSNFLNNHTLQNDQTQTQTHTLSKPNELIEVTFFWKDKGEDVFITGSFAGWKQWFMLEKQGDVFFRKLQLPREKHYFKFIVDKDWRCADNYNKETDDKGNLNNMVDLTYIESPKKKDKNKIDNSQKNMKIPNTKVKLKPNDCGSYSEIYPERSGLNTETPIIPSCYTNNFDINNFSFQNKIGKPSYINLSYKEIYCNSNNSTAEISLPPHINM